MYKVKKGPASSYVADLFIVIILNITLEMLILSYLWQTA